MAWNFFSRRGNETHSLIFWRRNFPTFQVSQTKVDEDKRLDPPQDFPLDLSGNMKEKQDSSTSMGKNFRKTFVETTDHEMFYWRYKNFNLNYNSEKKRSHLRIGESFSCLYCKKNFQRKDMLNRHLRMHTGARPYKCEICNLAFSRTDNLATHRRTHTRERPHHCPYCFYSACRSDTIVRHLRTRHSIRLPSS